MGSGERDGVRIVEIEPGYEGWHAAARRLLLSATPPGRVEWRERAGSRPSRLDPGAPSPPAAGAEGIRVPRRFVELARAASDHDDPDRWRLLYDVLWRVVHGDRELLDRAEDPAVKRVRRMAEGTSRRPATGAAGPAAPSRRGAAARPARARQDAQSAAPFVPGTRDLVALGEAAARCQGCDLHRHATQTVFGQGTRAARLVLVGEQPGDQEDRQGLPFVGPAGEVLDRALAEAGIDRKSVYVTNAVKHFKFTERGKRRIHEKPSPAEVAACRPWLEAELRAIEPDVILCLGATAAASLIGPKFRVLAQHGQLMDSPLARKITGTIHPSAVLRGPDEDAKARLYAMLVDDLRAAATILRA
jgi:DNA polymerase